MLHTLGSTSRILHTTHLIFVVETVHTILRAREYVNEKSNNEIVSSIGCIKVGTSNGRLSIIPKWSCLPRAGAVFSLSALSPKIQPSVSSLAGPFFLGGNFARHIFPTRARLILEIKRKAEGHSFCRKYRQKPFLL